MAARTHNPTKKLWIGVRVVVISGRKVLGQGEKEADYILDKATAKSHIGFKEIQP